MIYDPADYWSDVAQRIQERGYDGDLGGDPGPFHNYRRRLALDRLTQLLPVEDLAVLELGCGPGGNLRVISSLRPGRLVGADLASGMVKLAARNTADINAEIVQLNGTSLPFADQEFDSTLTVTVLQHNSDQALAGIIAELARVTRKTMLLLEDTTAMRSRSSGSSYFVRRNETYIQEVTGHGFRLLDCTPADVWASEKGWIAVRRAMSVLDPRTHDEGRAVSSLETGIERMVLSLTRQLDEKLPQLSGNTALRFERLP